MIKKTYRELLSQEIYVMDDILNWALIIHPNKIEKYWLKNEEISMIFEEWSNFFPLKNKIIDEFGNLYWDSEGFYMSQRVKSLKIKEIISHFSMAQKMSKKIAYMYEAYLDKDIHNRIKYMRKAIKAKFDVNLDLRTVLIQTWDKEIIEYTYWWDTTFGVCHKTKNGSNILWKLLMEYRDSINWVDYTI